MRGKKVILNKKKPPTFVKAFFVELRRFELRSKQAAGALSTCLAFCWFSSITRKKAPKLYLSPLISFCNQGLYRTSPKLCCTPLVSLESGMSACGMSRPDTLCQDKALIYYTSILGSESVISFANYLCENSF